MFDSPIVSCKINNDLYDVSFELYHNVNIISDKSGTGKSYLLSIMEESSVNGELQLKGRTGDYKFYLLRTSVPDLKILGKENYVIAIDDVNIRFYGKFITNAIKYNPNFVIILVGREFSSVNGKRFSCFYDAVYTVNVTVNKDKDILRLSRVIDSLDKIDNSLKGYCSHCIIEGAKDKTEYNFYKNIFKNVISCDGKYNVIPILRRVRQNAKAILIVDLCAFGDSMLLLLKELDSHPNVCLNELLSFEYGLVSVLSEKNYENINMDVIDGKLFEDYFYHELLKIDFDKCGNCTKSKLVKCLVSNCDDVCKIPKDYRKECKWYSSSLKERIKGIVLNNKDFEQLYIMSER